MIDDDGDRTGVPPMATAPARRRRGLLSVTAIGRAHGRRRALLIATCLALVLAAVGDEATGYDGPGPLVYLAFAGLVALCWWRFTPLLAAAMACFFVVGGLSQPSFLARLTVPGHALDFAAGWLQMLSFIAAGVLAVAAARAGRGGRTGRSPAHSRLRTTSPR